MTYLRRRFEAIYGIFSDKQELFAVSAMTLFLVFNALKITLFNFFIITDHTFTAFKYKLEMTILLVVIIYPLFLMLRTRLLLVFAYIFQIIYIIANISYYSYFHSYLNIVQWTSLFSEAFTAASHLAVPRNPELMIAFIDLPFFIYIAVKYSKITVVAVKLRFFMILAALLSIGMISGIEARNYTQNCSVIQYARDEFTGESPIVQRYGTIVNNLVSLVFNKSKRELLSRLENEKTVSGNESKTVNPNFIVIQVESMDSNVINQQYKGRYIAPYLHELSNESIYYPYTMSYHMGGGTSDSEFSIINSVEPLEGFPAIKLSNFGYPNSMLTELTNAAYRTLAYHGNTGSFFNRDAAFPKMGFQEFFDINKMGMKDVGWGAPDGEVFDYMVNNLKTIQKPFFSYVITMTSHGPFTNARFYYNNEQFDDLQNETVKNYFNSISYVDKSLEKLVSDIKANFKNTYIFIWGDHTPDINTPDYKQASFVMDSKYFEFVPLIILTPDNKVYRETDNVASFLDIAPTILSTSGTKFEIQSDGINLLNFEANLPGIPFKGAVYNRNELFTKVSEQ